MPGETRMSETTDDYLDLDGMRLHYLAAGLLSYERRSSQSQVEADRPVC